MGGGHDHFHHVTTTNMSAATNTSVAAGHAPSFASGQLHAFGLGCLMGTIHAVTGPDHMSALVTLAVNHHRCAAAWLGLRWGMGHSIGLLVVTGIMLILRDAYGYDQKVMLDVFEGGVDWLVGVIMLLLGVWGYRTAWLLRRAVNEPLATTDGNQAPGKRDRVHEYELSLGGIAVVGADAGAPTPHGGSEGPGAAATNSHLRSDAEAGTSGAAASRRAAPPAGHMPSHSHALPRACHCHTRRTRWLPSLLAVGVGVLHGIGGPGGVLAVLPTLLIPGALASCLYLGAFCVATTLVMGAVACAYGACTFRSNRVSPRLPWMLQLASATTSVAIGILWLVCTATGTLADVLGALGMS